MSPPACNLLRPRRGLALLLCAVAVGCAAATSAQPRPEPASSSELEPQPATARSAPPATRQYTFSWMFADDSAMAPRGGTTLGPEVTLAESPDDAYRRLTESAADLPAAQRDRRAILAMAGAYRTSFDFIETMGFEAGYQPARPYQSWGTEYVYVVADEPEFVSLQHILVMTFGGESGADPVVVKHWRQDWRYQDRQLHAFAGNGTWQRKALSPAAVAGTWSQAVYQVDDSPRYEAIGRWLHRGNHSTWTSENTWRPLPRREFSVRDDYDVLSGINRLTITPLGWVHEEDNLKVVLDDAGHPAAYLAREAGVNRYQHIVGYDFSAGDDYWRRTAPFWAEVRLAWDGLLSRRAQVRLRAQVGGERLFEAMFGLADRFAGDAFDQPAARQALSQVLDRFVAESSASATSGKHRD